MRIGRALAAFASGVAASIVPAALIAGAVAVAASVAMPSRTSRAQTWQLDIYDAHGFRWQDPDKKACTAAATEMMLNMIALEGGASERAGFIWKVDTTFAVQEKVLAWERENMTMLPSSDGTDPHGWRNALNYFGWGSIRAGVYRDVSYASFDEAAHAVVRALARTRLPVGILVRSGSHSQIVTGYVVSGEDPRVSDRFHIVGVYLADPLFSARLLDGFVTLEEWQWGTNRTRFSSYLQTDSPYWDVLDASSGYDEWYRKWVVIEPVA
jgi:hypothetical protein